MTELITAEGCSVQVLRHPRHQGAQQGLEAASDAFASFHYFLMRERLVEDSCSHVGDAGDSKHFDSDVAGGDDFADRGHADQICSDDSQVINFSRSLVAWAGHGGVDALVHGHFKLCGFLLGELTIAFVVGVRHVGKTDAKAIVIWANERIRSLKIDVIANHHEHALLVTEVNAAGSVSQDDRSYSHASEDAHGKSDCLRGVSFVEMYAALHCGYFYAFRFADNELSRVANGCGTWECGDFCVSDARRVGE